MSHSWFARRFPVGHPRNAMAPVSPEGRRVARDFIGGMVGAAVLAGLLLVVGFAAGSVVAFILAPLVFAALALGAGLYFIRMASAHGDMTRTVEDYRRMGGGTV